MSASARPPVADRRGSAPIAWFWGDDAWSIDRAVADFAARLADGGVALDLWRAPSGDDDGADGEAGGVAKRRSRVLDEAAARVGTATLFGGGTLVITGLTVAGVAAGIWQWMTQLVIQQVLYDGVLAKENK